MDRAATPTTARADMSPAARPVGTRRPDAELGWDDGVELEDAADPVDPAEPEPVTDADEPVVAAETEDALPLGALQADT